MPPRDIRAKSGRDHGAEPGQPKQNRLEAPPDLTSSTDQLRQRASTPLISRKRTRDNDQPVRWVVEQILALHQF